MNRMLKDQVDLYTSQAPSQLLCFPRWARSSAGLAGESRTMKTEVRCGDCSVLFVKHAYDGLVRCDVLRKARGEAAQEVRK
jgi:hypothetical protein